MVHCDASGAPLSGQRPTATFIKRIMPQPVEVDGILVAASDRRGTRHHHLEHRVSDALRIASIRHRFRKPPAEIAHRDDQENRDLAMQLASIHRAFGHIKRKLGVV
jgi:hypothetical protein